MQYKYCQHGNFEDFASGRVLLNKQGLTNFPVRLAQEIYCRCLSYSETKRDICIYDPCCGGGYLLTILGILNTSTIKTIIGSDINGTILETAKQNLLLTTKGGLAQRLSYLTDLYNDSGKASHYEAVKSAESLLNIVVKSEIDYEITVFERDAFDGETLKEINLNEKSFKADIIFTDIPYGSLTEWGGDNGNGNGDVNGLLDNLYPILKPSSIIAVCSDKKQKIICSKYVRLEKQLIGKRKFEIFKRSGV